MSVTGKYLPPMLDAGSSRVFNCNDVCLKLERAKDENPHIFKSHKLHKMVLIKEVLGSDDPVHPEHYAVGTKLYLPYDQADVYAGGQSIFLHAPTLKQVLHEQFGIRPDGASGGDLEHDLRLLNALDKLPSLDGFLMRDALELDGFTAHDKYFEVSDTQRVLIQEFIRSKMEQLVRAAYGGQKPVDRQVTSLIDKVWEAKDLAALDPLIQAFRFPRNQALSIFSGWKGLIFYSFEYGAGKEKREQFARWLKDEGVPKQVMPRDVRQYFEVTQRMIVMRLRAHWIEVESALQTFDAVYSEFVTSMNPGAFIKFLTNSAEIYWRLGDSLSKISHTINCWDVSTKNFSGRHLPIERLEKLMTLLMPILVPAAARNAEAA